MTLEELEETDDLIASSTLEGAAVFDEEGQRLGAIHALMLDKRSGRVTHVVLRTGGMMGLGSDYRLLPWSSLDLDEGLDGYVAELEDDGATPGAQTASGHSRFNFAAGSEPIGHYGLDHPDDGAE